MEENQSIKEINQNTSKGKGFRIASIIFLVLGIVLCWLPVGGFIFGVLSIVFSVIAKKKGNTKTVLFVLHIVASAVFLIVATISLLLFTSGSLKTVSSVVEDYAAKSVCAEYKGNISGTPKLTSKKTDEDVYHVSGEMYISKINYSEEKENIYKVTVDCDINYDYDTKEKSVISSNNVIENTPTKTQALPPAIDKIDKEEAIEEAKNALREKGKLQDDDSYVLLDSTVTAGYEETGIKVIVSLKYQNKKDSAKEDRYSVTFLFYDGEYHYQSDGSWIQSDTVADLIN